MPLNDEQKAALSERLRLGRERAQAAKLVQEAAAAAGWYPTPVSPPPPPVASAPPVAPSPSAEALLRAANENKLEITNEDIFAMQTVGADGKRGPAATREAEHQAATVTHQTAAKVRMFKPTPQGYRPRTIVATNIGIAIKDGWLAVCPDCGRADCGIDGDVNACTGREPRLYRECPVRGCVTAAGKRKHFYDDLALGIAPSTSAADPNRINDNLESLSTPEMRTLTMLRGHMLAFHPSEAPLYGFFQDRAPALTLQPQVGQPEMR